MSQFLALHSVIDENGKQKRKNKKMKSTRKGEILTMRWSDWVCLLLACPFDEVTTTALVPFCSLDAHVHNGRTEGIERGVERGADRGE